MAVVLERRLAWRGLTLFPLPPLCNEFIRTTRLIYLIYQHGSGLIPLLTPAWLKACLINVGR